MNRFAIRLVAAFALTSGCQSELPMDDGADEESTSDLRAPDTDVYVTARPDLRRCASPQCGGFWVSRVNHTTMVCMDRRSAASCYVSAIDTAALGLTEEEQQSLTNSAHDSATTGAIVFRGHLIAGAASGSPAQFTATEAWRTNDPSVTTGTIYRLSTEGTACSFQPCSPLRLASLNINRVRSPGAAEVSRAMATPAEEDSALVAGYSDNGVLTRGTLTGTSGSPTSVFHAMQLFAQVTTAAVCGRTLEPAIAASTDRVLYMSESDRPIEFFYRAGQGRTRLTDARLLQLTNQPSTTPVEHRSLDEFFARLTTDEDGASAGDRALSAHYRALRRALESNLTDVQVFRTGRIEIGVYIVGRDACGNLVGVNTVAIET